MFLASTCTCAVCGKRRPLQSAHVQVLAKNMASKKTPYGFVAGVTSLYVSTLCPGRGLLIPLGYLHPGKCEHSEVQSHPPLCNGRSMLDGFRRYAHARASLISKIWRTIMKSEHSKACEKSKTKTRMTATRLQETLEKR